MKSYEQMAKDVLKRRDEYLLKKQQRKIIIKHYMPMAVSFCFAVLVGLGIWKELQELPKVPSVMTETEIPTELDTSLIIINSETMISEQETFMTEAPEFISTTNATENSITSITNTELITDPTEKSITSTDENFTVYTIATGNSSSESDVTISSVINTTQASEINVIVTTNTTKTTVVTSTTTKVSETAQTSTEPDITETIYSVTETTMEYAPAPEPVPEPEPDPDPAPSYPSTTVPDVIKPTPEPTTEEQVPLVPATTVPDVMEPTQLPSPEQYTTCILETQEQTFKYKLSHLEYLPDKISSYLQEVELFCYDTYGNYCNYYIGAYEILDISPQDAIAVKFYGREEYFIYTNIALLFFI
ncbi:MAG: hypothetical protein K2H66_01970 [Oscillospiraceae bacterium]|nr:hypothetical protein [Oscillospiraceae bacterium]